MKNIYVFSGLGADKRVFRLIDFSGLNVIYIEWLTPYNDESLADYAKRLTQQIKHHRPILVGLSFGGMVVTEIAKLIDTEKLILIASAQTRKEIPPYFRVPGKLNIHKLIPAGTFKRTNRFIYWLMGVDSMQDKDLLDDILRDTDPAFMKWAIDKILKWSNKIKHKNASHIHGTADRLLPIRYVDFNIKVNGGGHSMTITKANELTELIRNEIKY